MATKKTKAKAARTSTSAKAQDVAVVGWPDNVVTGPGDGAPGSVAYHPSADGSVGARAQGRTTSAPDWGLERDTPALTDVDPAPGGGTRNRDMRGRALVVGMTCITVVDGRPLACRIEKLGTSRAPMAGDDGRPVARVRWTWSPDSRRGYALVPLHRMLAVTGLA